MAENKPETITKNLLAWNDDKEDNDLSNTLISLVYDELHRQAHR